MDAADSHEDESDARGRPCRQEEGAGATEEHEPKGSEDVPVSIRPELTLEEEDG